jgi:glycosyltransferase involved in cell wall biosynthesis
MSGILLTYIVPVYNTEAYVLRCLQSIVNQGLNDSDYEVIVVDDGSIDGSKKIVEDFAAEHPQVHVFSQENSGVSTARNFALDQASGRYVQFVDSDDYLEIGTVVALLQRALSDDLEVLVFNACSVMPSGDYAVLGVKHASTPVVTGIEYLQNHDMSPYVWRYMISRDFLNRLQLRFNPKLIVCEDGELITRFMLNATRVAHQDITFYCYVNRGESAMHNQDAVHLHRRIFSQIDSAIEINESIKRYETTSGELAPVSVSGLRNVYLYFSMTKAFSIGCVDEAVTRMKQAGLYPFPCVGLEANYSGMKWKIIHSLMIHPALWRNLSKVYRMIK